MRRRGSDLQAYRAILIPGIEPVDVQISVDSFWDNASERPIASSMLYSVLEAVFTGGPRLIIDYGREWFGLGCVG